MRLYEALIPCATMTKQNLYPTDHVEKLLRPRSPVLAGGVTFCAPVTGYWRNPASEPGQSREASVPLRVACERDAWQRVLTAAIQRAYPDQIEIMSYQVADKVNDKVTFTKQAS